MRAVHWMFVAFVVACSRGNSGATPVVGDAAAPACPTCVVEPSEPCAPGTAPLLGSPTCTAVGARCAAGFERDSSGFGCLPILPPAACTGATRDELGARTCVPVGDCSAVFPPAEASLFVEPGGSGAKTFSSVQAAIDAAPDGATIAISPGTYAEAVTLDRDVELTLVGVCAKTVTIAPATADFALANGGTLTVRGVTFRGGSGVVVAGAAAALTLEDVIVDGAVGNGISASKGTLSVSRSVVRRTRPEGAGPAFGVFAVTGAKVRLESSVVAAHEGVAVYASEPGTVVHAERTVLRDIRAVGMVWDGFGIDEGARLELVESALVGPLRHALLIEKSAEASLDRSTFWHVAHGGSDDPGGSLLADESVVTGEDFTLADASGVGLSAETPSSRISLRRAALVAMNQGGSPTRAMALSSGGKIVLEDSAVEGALGVAALVSGSGTRLELVRSLVTASREKDPSQFAVGVTRGASLGLQGSSIIDSRGIAIVAGGDGSSLELADVLVRGIDAEPAFGVGIYLNDGAQGDLARTVIQNAAGVGLVGSSARANFTSGALRANTIAVQVQRGSKLIEGRAQAGALEVVLSSDVRFEANVTRTGSSELALPSLDL